jgi:hypothetical protein
MTRAFCEIAFTDSVIAKQKRYGSADAYKKFLSPEADRNDTLGEAETAFINDRDGFYQATVSETGWPYVQFRGGPRGFVHIIDGKTLAYADFRGNRQYLSVGNLSKNDRIALFLMDYPNQRRLKLLGHARLVDIEDDPALVARLNNAGYRAKPERAVVITVAGFDWNCPQHIPQRYTVGEIGDAVAPLKTELMRLEAENAELREMVASLPAKAVAD